MTVKSGGTASLWSGEYRTICERKWGEFAVERFTAMTVDIYALTQQSDRALCWEAGPGKQGTHNRRGGVRSMP